MNKEQLMKNYASACNDYLKVFCNKHGYAYSDIFWAADEVGGIACVGDYFFNMTDIKTDIDREAQGDEIYKWYEYSLRCAQDDLTDCNYKSWLAGCPRHSDGLFEMIESRKKELDELINGNK